MHNEELHPMLELLPRTTEVRVDMKRHVERPGPQRVAGIASRKSLKGRREIGCHRPLPDQVEGVEAGQDRYQRSGEPKGTMGELGQGERVAGPR